MNLGSYKHLVNYNEEVKYITISLSFTLLTDVVFADSKIIYLHLRNTPEFFSFDLQTQSKEDLTMKDI